MAAAGAAELRVYNALGQTAARLGEFRLAAGSNRVQWNTAGLSAGVYLLHVRTAGHTATGKVLLVR